MYDESHLSTGHSRSLFALLAVAIILALTLGKPLLEELGIPYSSPGGALVWRFHLSSYVILLAVGIAILRTANPGLYVVRRFSDQPLLMAYLVVVVLTATILLRNGPSGLAYIVDALIMPALLALLLVEIAPRDRARLFVLVMLLILANSVIAVGEAAMRIRLIEFPIDMDNPFRATALLGHPLNNALITTPAILFAAGFGRLPIGRLALVLLFAAAMLAFGGRAAAAASSGFLLLLLVSSAFGHLRRGTMPLQNLIAIPLALLIVPMVVTTLWFTPGLAARLQEKLFFDPSAQTRVNVFKLFDVATTKELYFGVSGRTVADLTEFIPYLNTIENFWVFLILQMGVVMFVPFALALACFLLHLFRRTTLIGRFAIVVFMLVASTNNSLTSKTAALSVLAVLVLCAPDYERWLEARRHAAEPRDLAHGAT